MEAEYPLVDTPIASVNWLGAFFYPVLLECEKFASNSC